MTPISTPDSSEFWEVYDAFCQPANLERFIAGDVEAYLIAAINALAMEIDTAKQLRTLSHPQRGWERPKAWLCLKPSIVREKTRGDLVVELRVGDVVIDEIQWDRDLIITHVPQFEMISGFLLTGSLYNTEGIFLPLFDRSTIMACINLRLAQNQREALRRAEQSARDWKWY